MMFSHANAESVPSVSSLGLLGLSLNLAAIEAMLRHPCSVGQLKKHRIVKGGEMRFLQCDHGPLTFST